MVRFALIAHAMGLTSCLCSPISERRAAKFFTNKDKQSVTTLAFPAVTNSKDLVSSRRRRTLFLFLLFVRTYVRMSI